MLNEDIVRTKMSKQLGFAEIPVVNGGSDLQQGVGQQTSFKQLGFNCEGSNYRPDGWYLPKDTNEVAIVCEAKSSDKDIKCNDKQISKYIAVVKTKYKNVIGIIYNGVDVNVYKNSLSLSLALANELHNKEFYFKKVNENEQIDKPKIYSLTKNINDILHSQLNIKNLYHRMIFTATSIVAIYFDNDGYLKTLKNIPSYDVFKQTISDFLKKRFEKDNERLEKIKVLLEVFNSISPNIDNNEAVKKCIENLCEISDCVKLSSDNWRGEDVMGIFFNEFNRYKGKSESGQVFTPDHITSFICKLLEVNSNDVVLDATCGSGAFLTKAMAEMIKQVEFDETKIKKIKKTQIYGIEFDKEIFALACANMLIHNDGKSGLINGDSRTTKMEEWIKQKPISKVLMNPPFENKFGCLQIVLNVLNNVKEGTKCAFILPDKKLEKASKKQREHLLQNNRIEKIIKLPTNIFKQNTETSIFIITAGVPQNDKDIYTCYIEDDGLETLKNQGRHDINNKWRDELESYWLDFIEKNTIKEDVSAWIKPSEHLSFQTKQPEFEIFEEDFRKTIFEYYCFQNGIDVKKYKEELVDKMLYSFDNEDKKG